MIWVRGGRDGGRGGGRGEEVRVTVQVTIDIRPGVRLARASDVPAEAVEVEVVVEVSVGIRPDNVVDVEIEKFVGEHRCGVVFRAKFEGCAG